MIFVLDNYDSFTWNLVHYLGEIMISDETFDPSQIRVERNDQVSVTDILDQTPDMIVISPGPCAPDQAGVGLELAEKAIAQRIPLLGVCLGHQIIAQTCGAKIVRADQPMHGKTSKIRCKPCDLFANIGVQSSAAEDRIITTVTRYHSLVVDAASLPDSLEVIADCKDTDCDHDKNESQTIMAIQHRSAPAYGLQFHPESIETQDGKTLLRNFVALARQ